MTRWSDLFTNGGFDSVRIVKDENGKSYMVVKDSRRSYKSDTGSMQWKEPSRSDPTKSKIYRHAIPRDSVIGSFAIDSRGEVERVSAQPEPPIAVGTKHGSLRSKRKLACQRP